ncbi:hypothetical protein CpB0298 [Chlamydia pneumoniae TW-183]|uniref:Uncharacterized protein n=1 Tax=Chlamydia pneumoniae TaxID=83558 RepID=A0ABN3YPQ5_CHLPN|nr:hypothetical protein CpB0298 [Chlamydia pneumoniae TW-183]
MFFLSKNRLMPNILGQEKRYFQSLNIFFFPKCCDSTLNIQSRIIDWIYRIS